MLLLHVTSTAVSMLAPTASTVTSLPASEAQQFIAVGSSTLPPVPPPARIFSTSAPLILDTYSPARLMLRGQLDPEVLKLIPLRSVSLNMRMSPVPLSRRQTLDPDRTLASGKLSGSRCVLAAFHAHFTREKSTVLVSGFAAFMLLAWAVANSPCACAFVVPMGLDDMPPLGVAGELTAEGPVGDRTPPSSSSPPHPTVDINSSSVIPVSEAQQFIAVGSSILPVPPPYACAFVVPIGLDDMPPLGVAGELTAEGPVGDRTQPSSSSPPHPAVDINSASVIPVVILIVILPFNLMRWPRFIGQVGG